jgi:predicted O-methyltransferase YrrM
LLRRRGVEKRPYAMSFAVRDRIVEMHGAQVLKRSALSIRGGAHVFERCLSGKGYKIAVEIGTYRGVAAAEIAQYVERVVTLDLIEGKLERSGEKFDRVSFWESLSIKNIDLKLIEDDREKRAILKKLDFDFAFIDGAHDATVSRDFEMVKKCGRVLFHDYDRRGIAEQDHVCNFVDSLPREQIEVMDIFALWTAPC